MKEGPGKGEQDAAVDVSICSPVSPQLSKSAAGLNDSQISPLSVKGNGSLHKDDLYDATNADSSCLIDVVQPGKVSGHSVSSLVMTAGQLLSLCLYLSFLTKTAVNGGVVENAVPLLFLTAQFADYMPVLRDLTVSMVNAVLEGGKKERDILRLRDTSRLPSVDVIITCCRERLDVILDTVIGACNINWPSDKFSIVVSDDGKDAKLKEAIEALSSQYKNLKYFCRQIAPGEHHGYKAGNVNRALREALGGDRPSPLFFCLDADMIPHEDILRAVVPHAVQDPAVGLVSLPQVFYNIPVDDPLNQNLVINHEHDQAGRDKINAAWCLGSGFLVRRAAWEAVGGFCERSICEDILFGWCLNGAGWKTIHVNERLQTGLQPETFADHVKQRRRWCVGSIHNAVRVRFGLWTPQFKHMSVPQRLACIFQCPEPILTTVFQAWSWLMVCLCLGLGRPLVHTTAAAATDLIMILSSFAVFVTLQRVHELRASRAYGMASLRRRQQSTTWLSLHLAAASVKEIASWCRRGSCDGTGTLKFSVTGAAGREVTGVRRASIDERSLHTRPRALGRVASLHKSDGILWDAALFLAIAGLVALNTVRIVRAASPSPSVWPALLAGPLFPGLGLERVVWFLAPLHYALFPPTMRPRHAYMFKAYPEHSSLGGYRPHPDSLGVRFTTDTVSWRLLDLPYVATTLWAVVAVIVAVAAALT